MKVQLALALHPDKNGAPGADEAFKSELMSATFVRLLIGRPLQWSQKHFKCYRVRYTGRVPFYAVYA